MTKIPLLVVALAATAAIAALPARAADLAAGKAKAQEVCQACHGMDGQSAANPEYPKLAGQYPDYLAKALRGYKAGTRKNAIMAGMSAALSDKDIENLAAYYAAQPGVLTTRY
jgi:cytochrome c553